MKSENTVQATRPWRNKIHIRSWNWDEKFWKLNILKNGFQSGEVDLDLTDASWMSVCQRTMVAKPPWCFWRALDRSQTTQKSRFPKWPSLKKMTFLAPNQVLFSESVSVVIVAVGQFHNYVRILLDSSSPTLDLKWISNFHESYKTWWCFTSFQDFAKLFGERGIPNPWTKTSKFRGNAMDLKAHLKKSHCVETFWHPR